MNKLTKTSANTRLLRRAFAVFVLAFGLFLGTSAITLAQVDTTNPGLNLGNASPVEIAISVINWGLGLLALGAAIVVLYGGFLWILSRGDEEKIVKAKAILTNGLIGLVIILASWGIATFIINLLLDFTDANIHNYEEPPGEIEYGDGSPFYVDHTNPQDEEENVTLCHIVAATFSYPLNEASVTSDSFQVWIPSDSVSNPDGGKSSGDSCDEGVQCRSGVCEASECVGDQLSGSFDFSESSEAAVFYPSSDYYENTTYRVELTTDIQGIDPDTGAVYNVTSGDPKRDFTFTTGSDTDDIPPTVNVTSIPPYPTDGEIDVCLNPTLQVSFSESLDPASPDDENVWLYPYTAADPSDSLDVANIHLSSIGGEADDTIVTNPEVQLMGTSEYGMNLYSGDQATDTLEGAIKDTCGNALSGDFDLDQEGSRTDDFVDPDSTSLSQAFCSCTSGVDSCRVDVGSSTCQISDTETCDLGTSCSTSHDDYVGFDYQWTWTTGDQVYCIPEIDSITQEDQYYSEDQADGAGLTGSTGSEDSGKVLLSGNYLYPFYDVDFVNNISAAGLNCFDTGHSASMSCFVSNVGSTSITVRTPVASQTGTLIVTNADGSDRSTQQATIESPYVRTTSPLSGPAGQFVTIKGTNFIDYDPAVETSARGQVFFDGVEAQVQCDDGWDDDQIIVAVPEGFTIDDTTNIQVLTVETRYSNERGFTIEDGDPGPGICELEPECSDTGEDDVTIVGENYGSEQGLVYFEPMSGDWSLASIQSWDTYDATYDSQVVITNQTPVTDIDTYDVTVANGNGISNGLDFEISCSTPPQLFRYYQCNIDTDTVYLPNPSDTVIDACVNNAVMLAFTNNMDNSSVEAGTHMYRCNYGYSGDSRLPFDETQCTTAVDVDFTFETLNDAYLGGSGVGNLDGSQDVDGDGENDYYEGVVLEQSSNLEAGYYYQMVVDTSVVNSDGAALQDGGDWYFQVRNDSANCVADYVALSPLSETVGNYDSTNVCIDNYTNEGSNYSLRARQYTEDCLLLGDEGQFDWEIENDPVANDIIEFGSDNGVSESANEGVTDLTTSGYNSVCVQGQDTDNTGTAEVAVAVIDPSDGSEAATDISTVVVDFGYCTNDSDCYTNQCTDTYCDLSTNHCAPDITSFSPNTSGTDVGPLGCVTLNGCYFGTDRTVGGTCTCESLKEDGETCEVTEDGQTCLLDDRSTTCSIGEETCDLGETCSGSTASAYFRDSGGLAGCTCTAGNGETCSVAEDNSTCVAPGDAADICSSATATWEEPVDGGVLFNDTTADYPSEVICGDIWDNDQVIARVPSSLSAGSYGITLNSHYYSELTGANLTDTFSAADGNEDCTVGTDQTPCLCQVDPEEAQEGDTVDLYGEGFSTIIDGTEDATFAGATSRLSAPEATWTDDNTVNDVEVPETSVTDDDDGVQVENDSTQSNALGFEVSCVSNLDCGTGCCSSGQCQPAEVCNACNDDTDCQYNSCESVCVDGMCAPYVNDISPSAGAIGQPVTIQGCHFGSYYDPALYSPYYSKVEFDGIEAALACGVADSWNNNQIIVTVPDGVFSDASLETAQAVVTQAYNNGANSQVSTSAYGTEDADGDDILDSEDDFLNDQDNDGTVDSADPDHPSVFTQDNSCSEVDVPVLCDATPGYSAYTTTYDIQLEGENFLDDNAGYCSCNTDYGDCTITEGATASCSATETTTYYVNSEDTAEACTATTSNSTTYYDTLLGYCVYEGNDSVFGYVNPDDTAEVCSATTSNAYTTWNGSECVYVDPDFPTQTCAIASGDTNCSVCTIAEDDTSCEVSHTDSCDIDDNGDGTTDTCSETTSGFVAQSGSAEYTSDVEATIDWTSDTDQQYFTDVPDTSETGDVTAIAIVSNGQQCASNGIDFPITCSSCGDCSTGDSLNCNLDYGDGLPGICTADTTGFCREEPDSCCNNTSCLYDESDIEDTGACTLQPLLVSSAPDNAGESICPNAALTVSFDQGVIPSDLFTDASTPESDDWADYVRVVNLGTSATVTLESITANTSNSTLTLTQPTLLDFNTEYAIIIDADSSIASGANYQTGIVDSDTGVAVGCTEDQVAAGMCDTDGELQVSFTTVADAAEYQSKCGPAYADVTADSTDFVDADYTFIKENQKENFSAVVYAAGDDEIAETDDDQAITRINDGTDDGFYWTYDWDDDIEFASLEDLESDSCPLFGIITEGEELGVCTCSFEESCSIDAGDVTCSTASGVTCTTDSPSTVCDNLDSGYDGDANTCSCTVTDSCDVDEESSSCEVTIGDETATCSLTAACSSEDETFEEAGFEEDKATQKITADGEEGTSTVEVDIIGDGSPEQGWDSGDCASSPEYCASQTVSVLFCESTDYLVTYSSIDDTTIGENYNFYFAYCRGDDPQDDSFLPEFTPVFERGSTAISAAYGSDQEFIYEVAFKDALAINNDPTANNNTIALRVYHNNLDNDLTTIKDSINPELWFDLNSSGSEAGTTTTLDEYQTVQIGNANYIAGTNLDEDASTAVPNALTPYVFVLAYSQDAESGTQSTVTEMKDHFELNYNSTLSADCQLEKRKIVRDTKRVNDLGTIAYLLSSYYYNDTDANETEDFPTVASGSYIAGVTGSIWPSWTSVLGNALGQSLPTDPTNEYADATTNCPYNAPDLSAGDDPTSTEWTYYDEAGTCWDPILKDYYGPEDSYLYQYGYDNSSGSEDFSLYSNLEYGETYSWQESDYDPCAFYLGGATIDTSISNYSDDGCETFNYAVDGSSTTLDTDYATNFE